MYRKAFINKFLKYGFDIAEAKSEIDFAAEMLFNYKYKDFVLGKTLDFEQISKLEKVITERVETRKPIQQIIGQAYFLGRKFFVNKYTLIPRPETEILVNETLNLCEFIEFPEILDIGTGSGCIPVSLAIENKNINVTSVDISSEALETAKKNALIHNVYERIKFVKSDLFENVEGKFNIIVSNPPYIPLKDKNTLQIEVKDYEPQSALFTNDEKGIEFYEKIIIGSNEFLLENGYLAFELGVNQAQYVKEIMLNYGFKNIKIIKDLNKIERIIICQK